MKSVPGSFRDPSGFVFSREGSIYRQVNHSYAETYDAFMASGLYQTLVDRKLLVAHRDVDLAGIPEDPQRYRVIKPGQVPYISYPYEWSFSQLKAAAILTLKIQAHSLEHGFSLKDASAYNIQFISGRPIFIDTLSFEPYVDGRPWDAYKQFCQHFLAPLALIAHTDVALGKLSQLNIDGIPLPLASKLLPWRTRLKYSLLTHIHVHARLQGSYGDKAIDARATSQVSKERQKALLQSLASAVEKLKWKLPTTEWGNYYEDTNYTDQATANKVKIVDELFSRIPAPITIAQDFGANDGTFSRVVARHCDQVVSQDIDPVAVERNELFLRENAIKNVLPLVQDLSAPAPAIGWANSERLSLSQRGSCDAALCLALIHHLAISNNVPLEHIAKWLSGMAAWLVIEFVPKGDSQVDKLLTTREDIFPDYNVAGFESAFSAFFDIQDKVQIEGSGRLLYLMQRSG